MKTSPKTTVEKTENESSSEPEQEKPTQAILVVAEPDSSDDEPDYEALALKGQEVINEGIATNNVSNLKLIARLEKLGGSQDYSFTIKKALEAFGGSVTTAVLSQVLPDHVQLAESRERLIKAGVITETTSKNRKTLHLVEAA